MLKPAVAVIALLATACDEECWDQNEENNASCGAEDTREYSGESFRAGPVLGVDDHFVAFMTHLDYRQKEVITTTYALTLDLDGQPTSEQVVDLDLEAYATEFATDGAHSILAVDHYKAHWLRDGAMVHEVPIGAPSVIDYGDGAYWIAVEKAPRTIWKYDTSGVRLAEITIPDVRPMPRIPDDMSLAIDRVHGDVAVLSRLPNYGETTFVIDRVRDGAVESFDVLVLDSPQSIPWLSPVAMFEGTAAFLIGEEGRGMRIMMLGPDNRVTERRLDMRVSCTQFVSSGSGYVALCDRDRKLVLFDADGDIRGVASSKTYTKIAGARGGAIAVWNDQGNSYFTRPIDDRAGDETELFHGHYTQVGGSEFGCATTTPASLGWVLVALIALRWRRDRRRARGAARR